VPELIIIAGPNGAGKTSFANKYFDEPPRAGFAYLNADELARHLAGEAAPPGQLNAKKCFASMPLLRREQPSCSKRRWHH
jgi:predicted ABC-type ATPase